MRSSMIGAAAALLLFTPVPSLADAAEDAVKSAYAAWDDAFNKADANALAGTYDAEAVFLPATHDVINGREQVEAFFAGLFKMGVTGHKLEVIDVMDRGDTVIAAAKWSATGKDDSGNPAPWGGVATHVFKKDGDNLVLLVHTFN